MGSFHSVFVCNTHSLTLFTVLSCVSFSFPVQQCFPAILGNTFISPAPLYVSLITDLYIVTSAPKYIFCHIVWFKHADTLLAYAVSCLTSALKYQYPEISISRHLNYISWWIIAPSTTDLPLICALYVVTHLVFDADLTILNDKHDLISKMRELTYSFLQLTLYSQHNREW